MAGQVTGGGALQGIRVVELDAIGPVPFAATMLADHGADVLRIRSPRKSTVGLGEQGVPHLRGRPAVTVDLTSQPGQALLLDLLDRADVLLEGSRPGVLERLGLAPTLLLERNPALVVGRMTGWGQSGPRASTAGHDINYLAVAGALRHMARDGETPVPPLNLVADFGGGAMFLLFGVLSALVERQRSGRGQVVDAAMVDGVASLMSLIYSLRAQGMWDRPPGQNLLDTGAPFYDVYPTADGGYLAVGCLEPKFYALFLQGLGLGEAELPAQYDRAGWPELRARFAERIAQRDRQEWAETFEGTDACVTPLWDMVEAPHDPHLIARDTFAPGEPLMPGIAPRLDRTPGAVGAVSGLPDARSALQRWGVPEAAVAAGVVTETGA